jgi:nitrogen-specific signal transduction histidine kinase/CheY-like chemotaxis protein
VKGLIYASGRHQTAEKEAAAKLAATQEQLRQSQKMELLGQLTGGIAHDFNNLLGIVQLNLELIRERLTHDPEADEMAGMALQATGRGASLTHQLLAYARQQPLEPRTVNIETLVAGMAGLLGRTLGENIEIKTVMPAGLWTTSIDPHQLENALLNLGVNALHAMPDGGKLIIEASNKVLDEIYVELNPDVLPGHYVAVAVTDTGIGMPPDILQRVLEPFFNTKPVGKGSGLGLSMVHGFVKQSGGHLKIYSEQGLGTTVSLYLPAASIGAKEETTPNRLEVPASGGGECVMVVEDDPFLRGLTLKILAGLGYRTIEAEDGPTACEIFDQVDRIDLLLTDIVLPNGIYGPELARLARLRLPDIKVLYMSGYPRDAVFRDRMLDTGTHLLSKPFSKAALAEVVRQVIDERIAT